MERKAGKARLSRGLDRVMGHRRHAVQSRGCTAGTAVGSSVVLLLVEDSTEELAKELEEMEL